MLASYSAIKFGWSFFTFRKTLASYIHTHTDYYVIVQICLYMSLKTVLHPSFSPSNNKSAGIKFYKSMSSCYSSVNRMAAGSRLQVQSWIFSYFTYFSNILYAVKLRILGLKVQALLSARYFNHIIITISIYLPAATEWLYSRVRDM